MRFCTIVALNYVPFARVLARSVRRHTGERLQVFLLDGEPGDVGPDEPFDTVLPGDVAIDRREYHRMATIYDITEFATAVKPWVLDHLAERDASDVCFLDPDICVYDELSEIEVLLARHDVVVTPHITEPMPVDGLEPEEDAILFAGAYNLGFVAVSRDASAFRRWWAERLRRDCVVAVNWARFVDQRWMDLAPSLFDVAILRDPGYNVAHWNLHSRPVKRSASGFEVCGRPLRFFHFSGFSPLAPARLTKYYGGVTRTGVTDTPALARMCADYSRELLDAGFLDAAVVPYRFGATAVGAPIDPVMRRTYRDALLAEERSGRESELTDPFDPAEVDAFHAWLFEPTAETGAGRIARYYRAIYDERVHLRFDFPDLTGDDAPAFLRWCAHNGGAASIPRPYFPALPAEPTPPPPTDLADGVNLVGYLDAESGVGEIARLLAATLAAGGVPCTPVPCDATPVRRGATSPAGPRHDGPPVEREVTIACVNADEFPFLRPRLAERWPASRATVGIWAWEVGRFPDWMATAQAHVDEVWAYSRHAADAIAAAVDVPVRVVPPAVPRRELPTVDRADLGLPEGFLFLVCFDFHSVFERKNPLAVVDAFTRAFAPGEGPQLVLKGVNGEQYPVDLARLQARAGSRPDVRVTTWYETPARQLAWMAAADAYVSLHRAEGYGLTMAEAMSLGKPVIATGYSGNLEFMTDTNSLLVPWKPVAIPPGCGPYPVGVPWADPDVDAAAAMMRRVVDDPTFARRLGAVAREDLRAGHSPEARAELVRTRLSELLGALR